jgi:hypothetical protein
LETRGIWLIFGFVKTLKENFNTGCFVPSEGTTQLLLNPHFRNKMQQFIYEMKFIIIVLNVTFIYSSGQPFKKFAPFSQSNMAVSFCKVSLVFDRNTFRWCISRGHYARWYNHSTTKMMRRSNRICQTDKCS